MSAKFTIHEEDAPETRLSGRVVKPLITREIGAANMSLSTGVYEAGRSMPAHKHEVAEELLYVLSGYGEVHIDDHVEPIRPGSAVYLPPGSMHHLNILSEEPMKIVFVFSPSIVPGSYSEVET